MIQTVVTLLLLMTGLALSAPNLCENPKLDSITWVDDRSMWFITSGGYYWYIKDKEMPPTPDNSEGPLPEGFTTGGASVYLSWNKVCGTLKNVDQKDQLIKLVDKKGDKNQVIQFDVRNPGFGEPKDIDADPVLRAVTAQVVSGDVEAMFTYKDSEIYVIEGNSVAGVNFKPLCGKAEGHPTTYDPQNKDILQHSAGKFDATTMKGNILFEITGDKVWNFTITKGTAGKFQGTRSRSIPLKTWLRFPDQCPVYKSPTDEPRPPAPDEDKSEAGNQSPNESSNEGQSGSKEEKKSSGSLIWIILIVIVIIVIVGGLVAFFALKKSDSGADAEASAAKPQPTTLKSPATPAKGATTPAKGAATPAKSPAPKAQALRSGVKK